MELRNHQNDRVLKQTDIEQSSVLATLLRGKGRLIAAAGVVIIGAIIGILAFGGEDQDSSSIDPATTPVIAADTDPFKVKPAQEGGMDIPYQDSLVMNGAVNAPVESLIAPPDAPATTPDIVAAATETPPAALIATEAAPVVAPVDAEATPSQTAPDSPVTATTDNALEAAPPAVPAEPIATKTAQEPVAESEPTKTTAETAPLAAPKKATTSTNGTLTRIQMGAFRDMAAAERAWQQLSKKHDILSQATKDIVRADLGDKGIYYRVQGLAPSRDSANKICAYLKDKGDSCVIVK
jgi:hypothetical protein